MFAGERERLYGVPLARFTEERKEGVRRLRAAGDREGAQRLGALPKPVVSAWVVNLLWRRERERFDALLAAGRRMRVGQQRALEGEGVTELQAGAREQRELVGQLLAAAAALLTEAGQQPRDSVLDRVRSNLVAIGARPDATEPPPGSWVKDLPAPGFDALAGMALATAVAPRARPQRSGRSASGATRAGRSREVPGAAAPEGARTGSRTQEAEERAAARAQEQLERARRLAERRRRAEAARVAARRLARREEALRRAEERLEQARRTLAERESGVADAARARDEARRELERLETEEENARSGSSGR